MGDFRIIIDAVGGHGQDRDKKDGEVVDFGEGTPEALAKAFAESLNATSAKIIHWPSDNYGGPEANGRTEGAEVVDDLLNGVRKNQF